MSTSSEPANATDHQRELMDGESEKTRSEIMAQVRSSGTEPEVRLRIIVKSALPRYKVIENDDSLPGKPDIVIPSLRLVIFVDGCFWHRCPKHGRVPSTRRDYWEPKLERNRRRDRRTARELRAAGWSVWRVWEHDLVGAQLDRKAEQLKSRLVARKAGPRASRRP